MKNLILLSSFCLLLLSCGNNAEDHSQHKSKAYDKSNLSEHEQLRQEVIEGHDVGMAKISTLNKTKEQLIRIMDSLESNKVKISEELKSSMQKAVADLDDAYKSMFKWMEEYKDDSAMNDIKVRMEYLTNEKVIIENVKEKIFTSLAFADSILAELLKTK